MTEAEYIRIEKHMLEEVEADVPDSLDKALDPEWLSVALAHVSGGRKVATVELSEVIKAMASKVRVALTFEGQTDTVYRLCIKGFLDTDMGPGGGLTTLREADFYSKIAPNTSMRTPPCAAVVTDRKANRCIIIMSDLIAEDVHFYNALEPLTVDQTSETLDQLARLHANPQLLERNQWVPSRIHNIANNPPHISWEKIQELMHDERRGTLPDRTVDATLLRKAMKLLAEVDAKREKTVLHGDCHPGNVYRTAEGRLGFTDWQLVHCGHWSLDVAYHIASVLPEKVAEREERNLLHFYLDALQRHGGDAPDRESAWKDYRRAPVYGYYHWAITQRVDPPITHQAFGRLGAAVTRHDSYSLLGL